MADLNVKVGNSLLVGSQLLLGVFCLTEAYAPAEIWSEHAWKSIYAVAYALVVALLVFNPSIYNYYTVFTTLWVISTLILVDDTFISKTRFILVPASVMHLLGVGLYVMIDTDTVCYVPSS